MLATLKPEGTLKGVGPSGFVASGSQVRFLSRALDAVRAPSDSEGACTHSTPAETPLSAPPAILPNVAALPVPGRRLLREGVRQYRVE